LDCTGRGCTRREKRIVIAKNPRAEERSIVKRKKMMRTRRRSRTAAIAGMVVVYRGRI